MDLLVPFITGLTTGGLSCLAVQGGLLASSIAHEVEQSVKDQPARPRQARPQDTARPAAKKSVQAQQARKQAGKAGSAPVHSAALRQAAARLERNSDAADARAARPIVLFLVAKLIAYTILGFLLGLLGSVMQLSPRTQALLQAAIGVFMVGTALRMFNVHPIFRYFALEPPSFVTRYIRRKARGEVSGVTPVFLGALTVLIPCGVTQAMMAVAMGTGSAIAGATTMFAFILGTSPVFFVVAYLATRLGSRLEASFMRIVAIVVLVLGLISIDTGLTLAGWPYSLSNLRLAMSSEPDTAQTVPRPDQAPATSTPGVNVAQNKPVYGEGKYLGPPAPKPASDGASASAAPSDAAGSANSAANVVTINVVNSGYQPRSQRAKAGQPIKLALVTNNTGGCARAFVIPSLGVQQVLPRSGTTMIDVPAQKAGTKLYFSCSMGMYSGLIIFE